jgi:hypothetical protein
MQDHHPKPRTLHQTAFHEGPPCNFSVPPGRGIRDRALGTLAGKVGAMGGGGRRKALDSSTKGGQQESRKTSVVRGIDGRETAETLTFSHINTRKPAEILVARAPVTVLLSLMRVKDLTLFRNKED